jgi:hypothetical protein
MTPRFVVWETLVPLNFLQFLEVLNILKYMISSVLLIT